MTDEERKAVIIGCILAQPQNRALVYSPDGKLPSNANIYVVYDGPALQGAGLTMRRALKMACGCAVPLTFYGVEK